MVHTNVSKSTKLLWTGEVWNYNKFHIGWVLHAALKFTSLRFACTLIRLKNISKQVLKLDHIVTFQLAVINNHELKSCTYKFLSTP
jgi:hypothetical protein